MRIKRFAVSGFKNFTQEVILDDMGEICVIHGENNVGKSNLLEAMKLFFVQICCELFPDSLRKSDIGQNIYDLVSPVTIRLQMIFSIFPKEIKEFGYLLYSSNFQLSEDREYEVLITIWLSRGGVRKIDIVNPMSGWFSDYSSQIVEPRELDRQVLEFIRHNYIILIGIDRRISFEEAEVAAAREIIPQPLRLQLYDIKESFEPKISKRWKLFVKTMSRFNDILGDGEFVALYDRHANKADLVFDTGDKRIPINLLGSGIQQVVALIARLLVSNASFVAIEEPELNLRYTLQERLYEVFKEIVADPAGPSQIFLTSHSPAFEHGEHFYHMRSTEHGITVEKRPISQARIATGMNCDESLAGKSAPYSYVTSEGLVRLPESVLKDLNIPYGGGVFILKRKDNEHVELLTDEQYFNLFESADEETAEHE